MYQYPCFFLSTQNQFFFHLTQPLSLSPLDYLQDEKFYQFSRLLDDGDPLHIDSNPLVVKLYGLILQYTYHQAEQINQIR